MIFKDELMGLACNHETSVVSFVPHGHADYQAIGVRCREALLAFATAAQIVIPWTSKAGSSTSVVSPNDARCAIAASPERGYRMNSPHYQADLA